MSRLAHTELSGQTLPPEGPYPPAPWRANAQFWIGLFRTDLPAALPTGLVPLLGGRWRVVALVRYQEGSTLRYDELLIGIPARIGLRIGVYVEYLYVDNAASLWGGRRIWGLPKELATFAWKGSTCRVMAPDGAPLVTLQVTTHGPLLPRLPGVLIGIGRLHYAWAVMTAPMSARLCLSSMRILDWSPRYPFRLADRPRVSLAAHSARVTFKPPALRSLSTSR